MKNQCDGCRRGLPLEDGIHYGKGYDMIGCTKDLYEDESLVERLRKRADIRRHAVGRKSVEEGKPDRIADLLEESADTLQWYEDFVSGALCSDCFTFFKKYKRDKE